MDATTNTRLETLLEWKEQIGNELIEQKRQYAELGDELSRKESQLRNVLSLLEIEGWTNHEQSKLIKPSSTLIENTYAVMKEIGKPIYYRELAKIIRDKGIVITGIDPAANLLTHMSRDNRFDRIARGTYALKEWKIAVRSKRKVSHKRKNRTRSMHTRSRGKK